MNTRILREVPEKRERYVKHFQMKEKGMAAADVCCTRCI